MNWLAHLLLSEPNPAFRIGNLLPDILPPPALAACPPEFQAGIARHRAIDLFTDAHPVVRRSVARIEAPFRRYRGIITDILYDHFLTIQWDRYADISLDQFVSAVHASFDRFAAELPPFVRERLDAMRSGEWLRSYSSMEGVRQALDRTGARLRRPFPLGDAVLIAEQNYKLFELDFGEFFPELQERFQPKLPAQA